MLQFAMVCLCGSLPGKAQGKELDWVFCTIYALLKEDRKGFSWFKKEALFQVFDLNSFVGTCLVNLCLSLS